MQKDTKNKCRGRLWGALLICLLNLTLNKESLLNTLQFVCDGHISHCSRIRKNVTENTPTQNPQTDRESNYRGYFNRRWIDGLSGPTEKVNTETSLTVF